VSGTDAGIGPGKPHGILSQAIASLIQGGMAPAGALATATSAAAEACGVGHDKGSIKPGHDADLLIVDGDPLTDTSALTRIATVVLNGEPISPPAGD
jgi:imidazolonepropionase-like amidohydrolase